MMNAIGIYRRCVDKVFWLAVCISIFFTRCIPFPDDCTDHCVSQMQMMLDTIPATKNTSWALHQRSLLQRQAGGKSENQTPDIAGVSTMNKFFTQVCLSYESVEHCLEKCGGNSKQLLMVKQTYAGLKLICKDYRKDFFSALPCLTQYEPLAMSKCSAQIQQSHITTANFTSAIVNREFYSIRLKFRFLCKDLSAMINCMEPIVRAGCGDRSTNLMLHFITLEFSSFEQLYSQLAFNEPLPHHCRSLLSLSNGRNNLFQPRTFVLNMAATTQTIKFTKQKQAFSM
ncbi:unnamed protein product [Bursaphelenchus xylophilus]|uniref:(pine wood nematode) hypothetical protein n=1 Tax=Bursaphelenchus xylophilus TaxID=6326 RepID=A0A1I7RW63_BURXY|nr:unnamed protein product [Bursaphelenchus xylophilus]CAG9095185.1 unnamed protein product [Bursaphelenchus xylophilus]